MLSIFSDLIEKSIEVFMDDFSIFYPSFYLCLSNLDIVLKRCVETNLVLNWEKCHFMVTKKINVVKKTKKLCNNICMVVEASFTMMNQVDSSSFDNDKVDDKKPKE